MDVVRPREGQRVAYVGDQTDRIGSLGLVICESGTGSHIAWESGDYTLEHNFDLVVQPEEDVMATQGGLTTFSARAAYDERGGLGVVKRLSDDGHISAMSGVAEDALRRLVADIREDPSLQEVVSQLDADEADEVVGLVANVLLNEIMEG